MSFGDLPVVSVERVCACDKGEEAPPEEDRRLANWEKWISTRKKVNAELGEFVKRAPCQALMNTSEELRSIKEDKVVLEYTNIPHPHDKYRGSPGFWKTPVALPDLCDRRRPSSYFKVTTKEEKCEIPEIEYVKVPDAIKAEKGALSCRTKNARDLWDALEYRRLRSDALKAEIEHVQSYKPDLKNLYVQGVGFDKAGGRRKEDIGEVKLVLSSHDISEISAEHYVEINDVKITADSVAANKTFVTFDYDLDIGGVATEYLKVKNATPFALRYCFERREKHSLIEDIIAAEHKNEDKVFFFNLNEEVIQPGGALDIPIWFRTDKPGVHRETWKFCTRPRVWSDDFVVVLEAVSASKSLDEKCAAIKRRLEERADGRKSRDRQILYTYDRAAIFEAANQLVDASISRPKYLYDKLLVDRLEAIYERVKLSSHPVKWNYNIEDLRAMTKQRECYEYLQKILRGIESTKEVEEREIYEYLQTIMRGIELAKETEERETYDYVQQILRDIVFSKETKSTESYDYVRKLLRGIDFANETKQMENYEYIQKILRDIDFIKETDSQKQAKENDEVEFCDELEDIISQLEQPPIWINLDVNKYEWTYQILCACVDKISEEMDLLNCQFIVEGNYVYPTILDLLNSCPNELHDDNPKPLQAEDDGKKKKGGKEKEGKAKKKDSSKGNKKLGKDSSATRRRSFDPYSTAETTPVTEEETTTESVCQKVCLPPLLQEEYNGHAYAIFYSNLEKAIERMMKVLDNQWNKKIKSDALGRIFNRETTTERPIICRAMDLRQVVKRGIDLDRSSMGEAIRGVMLDRRQKGERVLNEVYGIMSDAAVDPNWGNYDYENVEIGGISAESKFDIRKYVDRLVEGATQQSVNEATVDKSLE